MKRGLECVVFIPSLALTVRFLIPLWGVERESVRRVWFKVRIRSAGAVEA